MDVESDITAVTTEADRKHIYKTVELTGDGTKSLQTLMEEDLATTGKLGEVLANTKTVTLTYELTIRILDTADLSGSP